jgi:uncharacterized protein (DUF1330 family)
MTDATAPAYLMLQFKAKNLEELMRRHGQFTMAMVQEFGGEMIAGTPTPKVLEGDWDGNWAAVLRFPSMAMAEAWYHSPEYQPLKDLRIGELTESGQLLLVEGVSPASRAR